jgi:hypothetical protein
MRPCSLAIGVAFLPCVRPGACPHCGAVGTMEWLPTVLEGRYFSLVTLATTHQRLRLRNVYCSSETCLQAVLPLGVCSNVAIATAAPGPVGHVLNSTAFGSLHDAITYVLYCAGKHGATPVIQNILFDEPLLRFRRHMRSRCERSNLLRIGIFFFFVTDDGSPRTCVAAQVRVHTPLRWYYRAWRVPTELSGTCGRPYSMQRIQTSRQ